MVQTAWSCAEPPPINFQPELELNPGAVGLEQETAGCLGLGLQFLGEAIQRPGGPSPVSPCCETENSQHVAKTPVGLHS